MLLKIQLPFEKQSIELEPNVEGNKVTILIGENGTRKSYLLRHILEDGIAAMSGELVPERNLFSARPKKIIALSALPSDRFPSKSTYFDHIKKTKFDINEYVYIGPRSFRNIVSRSQSARELVSSIFSNPKSLEKKGGFLSEICKKIGVSTSICFSIVPHSSISRLKGSDEIMESLIGRFQRNQSAAPFSNLDYDVAAQSVLKLKDSLQLFNQIGSLSAFPVLKVWVDLERGQIDYGGVDPSVVEFGFRHELLRATKIIFDGAKSYESLSAGQWATFSTLSAVALSVQNRSLILIDEPENGLHPLWQQEYVQNILSAINHATECHVVIATHSPLILSSLPLENSDCIVLSNSNGAVIADLKISPSGWDSNSLLEGAFSLDSPRGPELTGLVNQALKLISKGTSKNKMELKKLATELKRYKKGLPESDVLKEIITSIIELAK